MLRRIAEGRSLVISTLLEYTEPQLVVEHKTKTGVKSAFDPHFQARVIAVLQMRKVLKKDVGYKLVPAPNGLHDKNKAVFTQVISDVSKLSVLEYLTIKHGGVKHTPEPVVKKKKRKRKPPVHLGNLLDKEKKFPLRGKNVRKLRAPRSMKRFKLVSGEDYILLKQYKNRAGYLWYTVRPWDRRLEVGTEVEVPRSAFATDVKANTNDRQEGVSDMSKKKTGSKKSTKTRAARRKAAAEKQTTRKKKSAAKGKSRKASKKKATRKSSNGPRVPDSYREGSGIGTLYERLEGGSSVPKKRLFKGVDNAESLLRRLRRHGKVKGFTIDIDEKSVKMTASKKSKSMLKKAA